MAVYSRPFLARNHGSRMQISLSCRYIHILQLQPTCTYSTSGACLCRSLRMQPVISFRIAYSEQKAKVSVDAQTCSLKWYASTPLCLNVTPDYKASKWFTLKDTMTRNGVMQSTRDPSLLLTLFTHATNLSHRNFASTPALSERNLRPKFLNISL